METGAKPVPSEHNLAKTAYQTLLMVLHKQADCSPEIIEQVADGVIFSEVRRNYSFGHGRGASPAPFQ
jgi:hypothetical protein